MKYKAAILIASASALHAGTTDPVIETPDHGGDWLKPMVDIRTRYEFGEIDGLDASNAWTFRERLGLQTTKWNGFSALVDGEFTQAAVDEYSGGAPTAEPFDPTKTVIGDPETNELNQAYLQYDGFDSMFRFGRQRIRYDNDAFIGNVIWRQNEQTYDAASVTNQSIDGLTAHYAYLHQVNRIFGSQANGVLQDVGTESHLFNASYTGIEGLTLGAYAYIMNFESLAAFDNNTFGLSAKKDMLGVTMYGEAAWQDHAGATGATEAMYFHGTATKALGKQSVTLGIEHLDNGFKTPLATLHAFNGFADAFIGGRATGAHNGLTDTYISHTLPIFWGIKWINVAHIMGDDGISDSYGWEYDSVLVKKFDDHFTAIAKLGVFNAEGDAFIGTAPMADTTRFSVELNYVY